MTQDLNDLCRQLLDRHGVDPKTLLSNAPEGQITTFTRNWLVLLEDYLHLQQQSNTFAEAHHDKVLSSMVEARARGLAATLKQRVYDLAMLNSQHALEICCKCLVLRQLALIHPHGEDMSDVLRSSIQRDINLLSEQFSDTGNEAGANDG
ncbi:hypothetical protein WNY37_09935 [Henriciella sp. AS95]|uniref:hypothetical protein n=1 Tax=Henriciella sp. AS95 TaxID=3135782 RepID=UPI00317AF7E4